MSYVVEIDDLACTAHGDCAELAPDVFAVEETAIVVGPGPDEDVLSAAEACPTVAIRIIDANSGAVVYP